MSPKIIRLAGLAAFVVALLNAAAPTPPVVQKVSILPSRVNARIVLDSEAALAPLAAAYLPGPGATLQVEFGPARWPAPPAIPADEPQLVKDLKLTNRGNGRALLSLTLAEKVPFRYFSEGTRTVIELEKILRGGGDYLIAPETLKELGGAPRSVVGLNAFDVAVRDDRLDVGARLGRKAVANVFALDNPLRLFVDLFDSLYSGPTEKRSIGKHGVEALKIGQFMSGRPYSITRIVFDLGEPRSFAFSGGTADWLVSFGPESGETEPATAPSVRPTEVPAKPKSDAVLLSDPPAANSSAGADLKPTAPPQAAVKPKTEDKKPAPAEKIQTQTIRNPEEKYSGEVLSPRFKDADLRDVIMWLGERFGLNVVFDDEVKGTVTCNFTDIPWDQFLDIILKNKRLGKSLEGNVLRIAPLASLTQEENEQQKLRDSKEVGGPLLTKTYPLSYAKARDVADLLKTRKSDRGQLVVDDRTNTLILSDTKDRMDLMERLIEVLDTGTPQVSIEARIVEATSTFVRNVGIQWGFKGISDPYYGNQTSLQFPNKVLVDGAMIPQGDVTKGIGGPLGGYAVNLPAAAFNSAIGFSIANVLDTFRLDVALSALETTGDGKIVSSTKVTTLNNKQAEVVQGRQIPVQTTANFTVSTQFIPASLQLRATPQITADGTIIMDLDIQNNAADFGNQVGGIPSITTQSAKTQVMVPDGGTTVIGGIYRIEDSTTRNSVPFLQQIPILGALFKNFSRTKQNRELLIFITPRIIH